MHKASEYRKKQRDEMRELGYVPINNGYVHPDDQEKLAKYINSRIRGKYNPRLKKGEL